MLVLLDADSVGRRELVLELKEELRSIDILLLASDLVDERESEIVDLLVLLVSNVADETEGEVVDLLADVTDKTEDETVGSLVLLEVDVELSLCIAD